MLAKNAVLQWMRDNARFFRRNASWAELNWQLVLAVASKALEEINAGATHCSVREIIYFLSMRTGVAEKDGDYKIGNDNGADLARIFAVMYPQHAAVFEQRRRDTGEFMEAVGALCEADTVGAL